MALNDMHAEAIAGIVDRVVTRYRRDPTCMVQILREVQEACDWIPPEAIDRIICTGERLAARIVAALLRQNNLRGVAIDATDVIYSGESKSAKTRDYVNGVFG